MTLNFSDIEKLIESGNALPELNKFLEFATVLSVGIRTGQMQALPGTRETIIAAVVLQKLIHTKDGRKLLGIRASNKIYNEKEVGLKSPRLEIARRLGCGEITRAQALLDLEETYNNANTYPSRQTLARILDDLLDEAANLRAGLEVILTAAGYDGTEESAAQALKSIIQDKTQ